MTPDFSQLDWRQFERLCGALLVAVGCKNVRQFARPGAPDRGIDWVFETPTGEQAIAQVKLSRRPLPTAYLREATTHLENGLELCNAKKAFLIISSNLTASAR